MSSTGTEDGGSASTSPPATLAALIPRAANRAPTRPALIGLDNQMTWHEVDQATSALALTLQAAGLNRGDRVAIARRKGHESFIAVHGILRAGGVVVPIDPLAPAVQARAVLADADVRAVVGDIRTVRSIDPWTAVDNELAIVIVSGDLAGEQASHAVTPWDQAVAGDTETSGLPSVEPDDVAYIIFTSGSTGRPKGIVHTHRSAMAYATRAVREYDLTPSDHVAGMNPLHFDMSTLELYAAPLATCTIVVMSEAHLQFPAALTERSLEFDVTVWYTVPFLLRSVAERGGLDQRPLPALRMVLYGGEPYTGAALRQLMELLPARKMVNVYGPAEVNACTHHHVHEPADVGDVVPIGRPWDDVEVRVVNDDGSDTSSGEPGELWVSAPTVMRGYWKLDDLTAARLQPNGKAAPWYRTGDIVSRDGDGLLVFCGRKDHQVKIRGVRLELEAIESVLTDAPGVLHAVAGPSTTDGSASIIAAVMPTADDVLDIEQLRSWCRERLPAIAVPREIHRRVRMPRNASGKIDGAAVRAELVALSNTSAAKGK